MSIPSGYYDWQFTVSSTRPTTAAAFDGERGLIEAAASSRGERKYALGW